MDDLYSDPNIFCDNHALRVLISIRTNLSNRVAFRTRSQNLVRKVFSLVDQIAFHENFLHVLIE